MEHRKRVFTFLTFFVCTACLAFLTASLATNNWVTAKPVRQTTRLTTIAANETVDDPDNDEPTGKFRGEVHFGLFQGSKVLNYGFGARTTTIWMKQEMSRNPNLMGFGLWLLTVLCVAIAMVFGIVSSVFAIINTVMTPIEVITGIHGLFLWNGLAALFCTFGGISWLLQFKNSLRKNVMTLDEQTDGWTSDGRAWLGFSYFFVITALILFLINIVLVYCAVRPWKSREPRPTTDKINPEGVIMLY